MFKRVFWLVCALGLSRAALAELPQTHSAVAQSDTQAPNAPVSIDPYQAYAEGRFADAFDGFASMQVKQPKDIDLMLNIGASLYRLKDFAGAEKAWALAAEHGDPNTRAQALYDMGNSAFQQEHLKEAVEHFQSALSLNPKDEDAQHNLRLAKKRLEAQKQESQKNQDPNAPQDPNTKQDPNPSQSSDPNAPQNAKPQDGNQPDASDPNSAEHSPQSHDKQEPKDDSKAASEGKDVKDGDDGKDAQNAEPKDGSETQAPEPASNDANGAQKAKRMPRSQAERMLDAMGESRPRHAPPSDKAGQRPSDGMDW